MLQVYIIKIEEIRLGFCVQKKKKEKKVDLLLFLSIYVNFVLRKGVEVPLFIKSIKLSGKQIIIITLFYPSFNF